MPQSLLQGTHQSTGEPVVLCNLVQSGKTCCWQTRLVVQLYAMQLHDHFSETRLGVVYITCKRFIGNHKLQAYLLFALKVQSLSSTL